MVITGNKYHSGGATSAQAPTATAVQPSAAEPGKETGGLPVVHLGQLLILAVAAAAALPCHERLSQRPPLPPAADSEEERRNFFTARAEEKKAVHG